MKSGVMILLVVWSLAFCTMVRAQGGLGGGGPLGSPPPGRSCSTHGEVLALAAQALPTVGSVDTPGPVVPFEVFPIAGGYDQDLLTGNFVDLDPSNGVLDWNCGAYTYNGHRGIDSGLRTFDEQIIGVPIFAAQDGVVVTTQDGYPDMNTTWPNLPANFVLIEHPGQRLAYYLHLKNQSVAVSPGALVKAGQQIGLMGSSGVSGGPHLHFETVDQNGTVLLEPFAGACRSGASAWYRQPSAPGNLTMSDFGLSRTQPASGPPFAIGRDPRYVTTDSTRYYWMTVHNIPANTTWRVRWIRPDGGVALDAGPASFGNSTHWQWAWWWFQWFVPGMDTIPGTWTLLLDFNGVTKLSAPVDVVLPGTPFQNRPPQPITAELSPSPAGAGDALTCRVVNDWVKDDLDWDIVRFRYVWRVNGGIVRQVTSAARTDVLPRASAGFGDSVTCAVTANDGQVDGATVTAGTTISALSTKVLSLSLASGSCTDFWLDTGLSTSGTAYGVVGSLSGTTPGTLLGPGQLVPLNFDALTFWMISLPNTAPYEQTFGLLDGFGRARPKLTLPPGFPPSLNGLVLDHAGVVLSNPWILTNSVGVQLVP